MSTEEDLPKRVNRKEMKGLSDSQIAAKKKKAVKKKAAKKKAVKKKAAKKTSAKRKYKKIAELEGFIEEQILETLKDETDVKLGLSQKVLIDFVTYDDPCSEGFFTGEYEGFSYKDFDLQKIINRMIASGKIYKDKTGNLRDKNAKSRSFS